MCSQPRTQQAPRVSVIIPAYNCDRYIVQAVESVLTQTYPDFEIIVVDDGSSDDTRHVLEPYGDRIHYIYQTNQGVSAARNRGIQAARGEFVAFLDADDVFLPDKLAHQVACFDAHPSAGLVHSGWQLVDDQAERILAQEEPWRVLPDLTLDTWLLWRPVFPGAMMVRRHWLEQVGGFDTRFPPVEDVDLTLRLAVAGCESVWLKQITMGYRQHLKSATTQNTPKQARLFDAVYDNLFAQPHLSSQVRRLERAARYNYLVWLGWRLYYTGHFAVMERYLKRAWWYSPFSATETLSNWVQLFRDYTAGAGEILSAHSLSDIPEWQSVVQHVLSQKRPQVSVIIPAHNCAQYITQTIESVLHQSFTDVEVIVVDDGSTDETAAILERFGDRIYQVYQQNQGAAAARNRGLHLARGELIAFLDGDDVFLSDKLSTQVACFNADPTLGAVKTGWQLVDENGRFLSEAQPWTYAPTLNLETLVLYKISRPSALMVRRDWCDRVGGFNPDYTIGEDLDFMLRLALMGCPMRWVQKSLVWYRQHSSSLMSSGSRLLTEMERVMDAFFARTDLPDAIRSLKPQERYQSLVWMGWRMYRDGYGEGMADCLQASLSYSPYPPTETILNWLTLFRLASKEYGYDLDTYALTHSDDWQRAVAHATTQLAIAG